MDQSLHCMVLAQCPAGTASAGLRHAAILDLSDVLMLDSMQFMCDRDIECFLARLYCFE